MGRSKGTRQTESSVNNLAPIINGTEPLLTPSTCAGLEQLIAKVSHETTPYLTNDGGKAMKIGTDLRHAMSRALISGDRSTDSAGYGQLERLLKEPREKRRKLKILLAHVSEYLDCLRPATTGGKRIDLVQYLQDVQPGTESCTSFAHSVVDHITSLRAAHDRASEDVNKPSSIEGGRDERLHSHVTAKLAVLSARDHLIWLANALGTGLSRRQEEMTKLIVEYSRAVMEDERSGMGIISPALSEPVSKAQTANQQLLVQGHYDGGTLIGAVDQSAESAFSLTRRTIASRQLQLLSRWAWPDLIGQQLILHNLQQATRLQTGMLSPDDPVIKISAGLGALSTQIGPLLQHVRTYIGQIQEETAGDETHHVTVIWQSLGQLQDQVRDLENLSNALQNIDGPGARAAATLILSDQRPFTARARRAMTKPRPSLLKRQQEETTDDFERAEQAEEEQEEGILSEAENEMLGTTRDADAISPDIFGDQEEWLDRHGFQRVTYRTGQSRVIGPASSRQGSPCSPGSHVYEPRTVKLQDVRSAIRRKQEKHKMIAEKAERASLAIKNKLNQLLATLTDPEKPHEMQEPQDHDRIQRDSAPWNGTMPWAKHLDRENMWLVHEGKNSLAIESSFVSESEEERARITQQLLNSVGCRDRSINLLLLDRPWQWQKGLRTMSFTGERLPSETHLDSHLPPTSSLFFNEDGDFLDMGSESY